MYRKSIRYFLTYSTQLIITALIVIYVVMVWQVWTWVYTEGIDKLARKGAAPLNLYVSHLRGELAKYELLPELLSTNERLVELLQTPGEPERIDALNRYLETVNQISGASDTYLMDKDGLTIAASNWQSVRPFVGRNFSYRPYFQNAMKGGLGRYFALGSTSYKRGYYFAYPVRQRSEILGAVVIKVDISEIEELWHGREEEIIVSDPDGIIFITTHHTWRYHFINEIPTQVRERIIASNRYPDIELNHPPLITESSKRADNSQLVNILSEDGVSQHYLMQSVLMPEEGWRVQLLIPLDSVQTEIWIAIGIVSLLYAALLFLWLFFRQRNRRIVERRRCEEKARVALSEAHEQLEQRVEKRTVALRREIEERHYAEAELRRAQDELIQTARLAVIGQMSTGISHEINQPLAAMRSYADNARLLLDDGRTDDVRLNLKEISELTERMAQISTQLKLFARKTDGELGAVSLESAIEAAWHILRPQVKQSQTQLRAHYDRDICVIANVVLLEQVLVNLFANAMHAMEDQQERWIDISSVQTENRIALHIHDNGPGIPDENLGQIFYSFFTTREAGLGLGLSISQEIIESMGGRLNAANHMDGGAIFVLELQMAPGVNLENCNTETIEQ